MTTVALIGNPNCGKTTVFNALTGARQRVGNWPGVTVEKKTGTLRVPDAEYNIVDLPGAYSIEGGQGGIDERIAQEFLAGGEADIIVNVIDAAALSRGLYLTLQLTHFERPVVLALNMTDIAEKQGLEVDADALANALGLPVVPLVASRNVGMRTLRQEIARDVTDAHAPRRMDFENDAEAYRRIDEIVAETTRQHPVTRTVSEKIDDILLHPYLALPIFLGVMYLTFLFAINVGSAFIDFFDLAGSALFVEAPRQLLSGLGAPNWLLALLADGVGGGMQLVGTFIPVIGCLLLSLAILENSGYMARVAFIVDRLLRRLGLPGKSFVPLIVGFGCNVPAVMATRSLDSQPDRILTTLMAPYMSCGARLTVYALFAAAFFPTNGQNVVFALYLIGIAIAVLSALAVRKHLLPDTRHHFVMELPAYHVPTLRGLSISTWQRLKGFVIRAGKAIVVVVVALNVLNSLGTDGSIGNEDSEKSILSAIGKTITPVFAPMGISQDNWPATVGIFTGIFAKEVVVGTLDALYAEQSDDEEQTITGLLGAALMSVPANLADLGGQFTDPLGLDLGDLADVEAQAEQQEVQLGTIQAMQALFDGRIGAFAYLLFVLLYMPCVATIGVIYKEIGAFWAVFSVAWSFVVAYGAATIAYQLGTLPSAPVQSLIWIAAVAAVAMLCFAALILWGKRTVPRTLIPVKMIE